MAPGFLHRDRRLLASKLAEELPLTQRSSPSHITFRASSIQQSPSVMGHNTKLVFAVASFAIVFHCIRVYAAPAQSSLTRLSLKEMFLDDHDATVRTVVNGSTLQPNKHLQNQAEERLRSFCWREMTGRGGERKVHPLLKLMGLFEHPVVYLDIGAHRGQMSVPNVLCGKARHRVIAVDPIKSNYESVLRGFEANILNLDPEVMASARARFSVVHAALGNSTGTTRIYFPKHRTDNAALSEQASRVAFPTNGTWETVRVEKGDDIIEKAGVHPTVIKIDVQGAEIPVLQGLDKYLSSAADVIVIAENDPRLQRGFGYSPDNLYLYMSERGFLAYCDPHVTLKNGKQPFIAEPPASSHPTCYDITFWKPSDTFRKEISMPRAQMHKSEAVNID